MATKKCIRMSLTATIPVAAKLLAMIASYVESDVTDIDIYDHEQEFPENESAAEGSEANAIHPFGCPD